MDHPPAPSGRDPLPGHDVPEQQDVPQEPDVPVPQKHGVPLKVRLRELLDRGERSFSFEFFPPRDDVAEAALWQAIRRLEPLAPTFVSVTYGAGGSTRDRTTRITGAIARGTTLTPVAHLTCVGSSQAELRQVIGAYADAGVDTVLALRGDPPGGPGQPWVRHPEGLDHAVELVRLLHELSGFGIGVAAFPEKHPESVNVDQDARVLVEKAEAGADFAVTQFFFEADAYFRMVDRVTALGCDLPIIPGIMPLTNIRQIERFARLNGSSLPDWLLRRLEPVADDPAGIRRVGVEVAGALSRRLLDGGAPGLHFYTLNRSTATLEVFADLGLSAPQS
jgi:methylenetetrahydrofolate reductase (NADPH)